MQICRYVDSLAFAFGFEVSRTSRMLTLRIFRVQGFRFWVPWLVPQRTRICKGLGRRNSRVLCTHLEHSPVRPKSYPKLCALDLLSSLPSPAGDFIRAKTADVQPVPHDGYCACPKLIQTLRKKNYVNNVARLAGCKC